ncbi:MAG: TonB-dependent siderophore receptor, partial [Methylocystaceae bacterium]
IDSTGPLNADKSLLYRFIGVFDHADDFINFRHRNNGALMGALTWRPTSDFEANVQVEYYNQSTTNRGYYGQQIPAVALSYRVPWIVGRPADLPRNWTQNVADMYSHYPDTMERILVYGDWSYKFNDDWKVTNRFHYSHQEEDQEYVIANGLNLQTGNLARYIGFYEEVSRDTYSLNLDVTGKAYTGDLQHNLLIGFDYYDYHAYAKGDDPFNGNTKGAVPTFNIFAPYYSGVAWPVIDAERYIAKGNNLGHTKQLDVGYYIQDDISYNDTVHLLLGGRYDVAFDADAEIYGQRDTACFPICDGHYNPPWKGNKTERKFSPNAGLLFKITPEFSLYSSYSQSFANSNVLSRSFDNKPFLPEEAWQYEVGGKASLFEGRVSASVAAFDLHRTNALSNDPAHPGFSVASGEVRSRGIEGDIAGRVTDNVSLIGSYTYDDAIIIRSTNTGTSSQLGKRWPGVPRHSGNLWAKYDTAPDRPEGWTFGAGFYAVGLRQGNPTNSWAMPGYVRFDTMIGYRTVFQSVPIEAQLNVVNIGDAKYFEAGNGSYAYYGQPRTFIGSVKVKF